MSDTPKPTTRKPRVITPGSAATVLEQPATDVRRAPELAVPARGGGGTGGGGDPTTIGISSPQSNAAVVGPNPGVPIVVEGLVSSPVMKNLSVKVSLGGKESSALMDSSGDWTYSGLTAVGGNITIWAALYRGTSEIDAASVPVTVNNNPALAATISNPPGGTDIKTWRGPTTATGSATFYATISSCQVVVTINGGPAINATLGAPTVSGSQVSYQWNCPLVFSTAGTGIQIQATAWGNFTDSQGVTTRIHQQNPPVNTVTVEIDSTAPVVTITSPPPDFQTPDNPNGAKITVTGTSTDSESGVKSVVVTGDVVTPVTATLSGAGTTLAWEAVVTLPAMKGGTDRGQRILSIQAVDNANNSSTSTASVYLEAPFQPFDSQDSLSILAYLRDLVFFATQRITDQTKYPPGNIEARDLARNFYQPFDILAADEEIRQARLCIEVLRKSLAPVGYWKFDENSGTAAADSSGNNLIGTLQGGAIWAAGKSGSALNFDGASGYVQVGNAPQLRVATELCICAWVFPTGPGTVNQGGNIVSKEGEYEIRRFTDGSIQWAFANTTPGWNYVNTNFIAPANQWTHIVVRYGGGVVNTYANGQLVHSYFGSGPIGSVDANNHDFRIGGRQLMAAFFQGKIDEVRVFDRVLSDEEILAVYQGATPSTLASKELDYRLSAYQTLLLKLGTSYQELRLARAADAATRTELAARLGIDLETSRPDKLDALVFQPGDLTEAKLEQLFGLVDTTRNPLSPPASQDPDLLVWQKTHLRSLWKQQDYPSTADPNFPIPLIDPDLLVKGDFVTPSASAPNYALDLWNARTTWVSQQLQSLATDRQPGEKDQARLVRLVGLKLSPVTMADLVSYNNLYNQGTNIDSKLSPIPLTFAAFSYLIRLYNLAAAQPLLDEEWAAVYSILVQGQKSRQFSSWRGQEASPASNAAPILIDPTYFQSNLGPINLPEWRSTTQSRSKWQKTLTSRFSQIDSLRQALQSAVESAEEAVLPQLRDALLAAIAVPTNVPTLFSTGMVAGGLTLSDGAIDSHWVITATPSGTGTANVYATINKAPVGNPWLANSTTSRWISPQPDETSGDSQGPYTYRTTSDLTGFDPASVRIALRVAVDDALTGVKLNGQSLGLTGTGAAAFSPQMAITSGFVSGINSLEFSVNNAGTSANPTGLRVEFTSTGIAQASADWLSERLLIDLESSGAIKTTRVSQAIETIQTICSSVRTLRFGIPGNLGKIATWKIAILDTDFDADWQWMGSYATWRAAMEVFLYPENALAPSYLQPFSPIFGAVLKYLRDNSPLTGDLAGLVTNVYSNYANALPNDAQAQQWKDGLADVQNLIFETLSDSDLQTLRNTIEPALYNAYSASAPPLGSRPRLYWEIFYFIPMQIALQLQTAGRFQDALSCLRAVYAYDLDNGRKIFYGLKAEEQPASPGYKRADNWIRELDPHQTIAPTRPNAYTRFTLMTIIRCLLDFADAEFTRSTPESQAQARDLYLNALDLLSQPEMLPLNTGFQPNPVPLALIAHATNNLFKLRNGLNIAGAQCSASPSIASAGGSLLSAPSPQPTPYRYATLIDRAKQINQLAQQVESSYFAALQQKDGEFYSLLKANQDLELAGANLDLQAMQVTEANDGVTLAKDQKSRAQTQLTTYDSWINAGQLQSESDMIQSYKDANTARNWVAGLDAAYAGLQLAVSAATGALFSGGVSAVIAGAGQVVTIAKGVEQTAANDAEARGQIDAANASYERRQQEWQLQRSLAQNDLTVGQDQIQLANDKVAIASQQQAIANIQDAHARAIVTFLSNKFTNAELYEWMSGVLGGVYRYFLQQATAMAQLAERQLSFERQQAALGVIKADYWQPPSQSTTPSSSPGSQTDTRGITGSARLVEDITQLDQYAFLTDSRKLQLTKTISLARLVPFEFQHFRETGVLPFVTPMMLFDQDFPGHYLRLIKRVRVSVVALIPPSQGIKARLATTGISRVTLGGDIFQTIQVLRNSEAVALTSPMNATGLFELDAQPELLLPFEGTGVATSWEFWMPKAANLFDFSSIADVLLTVDYTALDSSDYRQQLIQGLNRSISLDRAFSFRQELADQWYDLNNPDQMGTPFNVQFSTTDADFPPNISELFIQNILLHFVHADNQTYEVSNVSLTLAGYGGSATSIDGTISIRRGNASAWRPLIGNSPIGTWTLILPDTPDSSSGPGTRSLFQTEAIQDILLVITYTGKLPAWDTT